MNSINFFSGDKFPQYRQALAKMQDMINLVAGLAGMGGKNFILSGCEVDNNGNVSDGVIVLNGEVIALKGAKVNIATAKITIKETRQDVNAFNVVYPETYINREAQFASNGEYSWSELEQVKTNVELAKVIKDITGDKPGTVKMWAGLVSQIPTDYMLCDGAELSINTYKELYDMLGVSFGGDGQNSFNLPDLRGRFVVGFDSSNPDYNAINKDKIGGANEVELATKHLPKHDHTDHTSTSFNKLSARAADIDATNTPSGLDDKTPDAEYRVGGMTAPQWAEAIIKPVGENKAHENRPPYMVLAYIIKVK